MVQNNVTTDPQNNAHHLANISVDALRLTSEILAIINTQNEFEYHKYDASWAAYDAASLVKHLYDLFNKPETQPNNNDRLVSNMLLVADGLCRFIAAVDKGQAIEDARSRLMLKSLNSVLRLIDYIRSCKENNKEKIAYATALALSIIASIKDIYEINEKETVLRQEEENRLRQIREKEAAVREAEEARTRSIREKKEAREQRIREKKEARERKIREKEDARNREIAEQERQKQEQEAARRLAIINHARTVALQRPQGDQLRRAWETVDAYNRAVTALENKAGNVNNTLEQTQYAERFQPHQISSTPDMLDSFFRTELSPWAYENYRRENEENRINGAVQEAYRAGRAQAKIENLQSQLNDISNRLNTVRTEAANAQNFALRLARQQGII